MIDFLGRFIHVICYFIIGIGLSYIVIQLITAILDSSLTGIFTFPH